MRDNKRARNEGNAKKYKGKVAASFGPSRAEEGNIECECVCRSVWRFSFYSAKCSAVVARVFVTAFVRFVRAFDVCAYGFAEKESSGQCCKC